MSYNRLSRPHDDKVIAGVCSGIARRYDWEPNVVRLIYFLVSFFSAAFPGVLVYIILWILIPAD